MIDLEFDTTTYRIIQLLKNEPKSRDSDKLLLELYYKQFECLEVPLTKVSTTPATIIRLRKIIQNKNPLLRSTLIIQETKEKIAENFRKKMGCNQYGKL